VVSTVKNLFCLLKARIDSIKVNVVESSGELLGYVFVELPVEISYTA
jgi:hypothetical protein